MTGKAEGRRRGLLQVLGRTSKDHQSRKHKESKESEDLASCGGDQGRPQNQKYDQRYRYQNDSSQDNGC